MIFHRLQWNISDIYMILMPSREKSRFKSLYFFSFFGKYSVNQMCWEVPILSHHSETQDSERTLVLMNEVLMILQEPR